MPNFFLPGKKINEGETIYLEAELHHHIARVLRLLPGEEIRLLDGRGNAFCCHIVGIEKKKTAVAILKKEMLQTEAPIEIDLFQAVPKGDRMEYVLEKSCELGVKKVFPLLTERTVKDIRVKNQGKKLERWQKIMQMGAQQSGRTIIPRIGAPLDIERLGSFAHLYPLKLLAWERAQTSLRTILAGTAEHISPVMVVVGPEGSFTAREIEQLQGQGLQLFSMGPRILRSDTAGLIACASVLYHFGAMEV